MTTTLTEPSPAHASSRPRLCWAILAIVGALISATVPRMAHAVDGCKVLLCFAAPSWKSIPECVPTIRQLERDLARGKPFPACNMAGAGNSAQHNWSNPPIDCPPQYTHAYQDEYGPVYSCDYVGAVSVTVNGAPFTRTWWTPGGDTVTEFTPAAKAQLKSWDTRFDDDYAAWLSIQPPPVITSWNP